MLSMLFQQFPGFKGAHGGGETGIALVEFETGRASVALGAAGVQDQPHAQHDALVRQRVDAADGWRPRVVDESAPSVEGRGDAARARGHLVLDAHTSRWRGGRIAVGGRRDERAGWRG